MTITPIAFVISTGGTSDPDVPAVDTDLVTDADLRALHPGMNNDLWKGQTSFRGSLTKAFDLLLSDLKKDDWESALISDSDANKAWFKIAVLFGTMILICRDFRGETGDRWDLLLDDYQKKYDTLIRNVKLDYDADSSGVVDIDETQSTGGLVLQR